MEMTYNEALVMPKNYAVVNEEEMTYVNGGWCIETHWWGCNLYLTHEERRSLTNKSIAASLKAAIFSSGIGAAVIAALGSWIWNYDDGNGVKIRLTLYVIPTDISALSRKEEKNIASKNKIV